MADKAAEYMKKQEGVVFGWTCHCEAICVKRLGCVLSGAVQMQDLVQNTCKTIGGCVDGGQNGSDLGSWDRGAAPNDTRNDTKIWRMYHSEHRCTYYGGQPPNVHNALQTTGVEQNVVN